MGAQDLNVHFDVTNSVTGHIETFYNDTKEEKVSRKQQSEDT